MTNQIISVVGLGYVGLPLAVAFAKHFAVVGFDNNAKRINQLKQGIDNTKEVDAEDLKQNPIMFSADSEILKKANFHIVAIPTPVNQAKQPDLSMLYNATETLGRQLKVGDIVVYESTVYPGATEEECIPILEKVSTLKCGKDFFVGYSPERVNPGDKQNKLESIVKIIAAQDPKTLETIDKVYKRIIKAGLYHAPCIKVAESAKLIENIQRDLNVALLNEAAMIFHRIGVDTQEVLKAASTKWNFLPFKPGLVGGHCIGVDPYYLTYKAQCYGYHPEVILAGRRINDNMGKYVAEKAIKLLIHNSINIKQAKVAILGVTFKENCPDIRNTRVIDIYNELVHFGIEVYIHDPLASAEEMKENYLIDLIDIESLPIVDALIIAVAHSHYRNFSIEKYKKILKPNAVIVDIKGILEHNEYQKNGYSLCRL